MVTAVVVASEEGRVATGADLRAHRKARGLTQAKLAKLAGIGRQAVYYWEAKARIRRRDWAPARMCEALGVTVYRTPMRARGDRVLVADWSKKWVEAEIARLAALEAEREKTRRVMCGAMTRKGSPCRNMSEPGRTRCKFHGGKSTGPRTVEGRARIAEAQRRRWNAWCADSGG